MRKIDIFIATTRITTAIEKSGLFNLLSAFLEQGKALPTANQVMETHESFVRQTTKFSQNENTLLESFQLDPITTPEFWSTLVNQPSGTRRHSIAEISRRWKIFESTMPSMIDLITPHPNIFEYVNAETAIINSPYMSLIMIEADQFVSTTNRISIFINGIQSVFEFAVDMYSVTPEPLNLVFCDNGSDKEWVFFSKAASAINRTRSIINEFLSALILIRERRQEKRIQLAIQTVSAIEEIKSRSDILGPERTKQLESLLVQGLENVAFSGVTTREIEHTSAVDARTMLAPQQKLLTYAKEGYEQK